MTSPIQPGKAAKLRECVVGGVSFEESFHVKEVRVHEDICKSYVTGELVIETLTNDHELFLTPWADATLAISSPPNSTVLRERFLVHSYESRPIGSGEAARMEHTVNLIGEEFFRDRDNTVQMSFKNVPGTAAVRSIHDRFLSLNGPLRLSPSMGAIGKTVSPHVVNNLRPIKAIHDILDRIVFAAYKTAAPVYFRDREGYVVAPLQELLENAPVDGTFRQKPAQGASLRDTLEGYDLIMHVKPRSPEGSTSPTEKSSVSHDLFSGEYRSPGHYASAGGRVLSKLAGRVMYAAYDQTRQEKSVTKVTNGHQVEQERFLHALDNAKKYYLVVPLQTGINITAGRRIRCTFPTSQGKIVDHVLFVPRVTHEVKFTTEESREPTGVAAVSEIYAVLW